jgi:hypothetical protein
MNKDLLENINLDQVKTLLEIANRARDKFGDRGYWKSNFDMAIFGIRARIFGLKFHYNSLQSIRNEDNFDPQKYNFIELDHHSSDILFNLDSSIECFVFALNAFGYGVIDSNLFISIEDEKKIE